MLLSLAAEVSSRLARFYDLVDILSMFLLLTKFVCEILPREVDLDHPLFGSAFWLSSIMSFKNKSRFNMKWKISSVQSQQ